MPSEKTIGFEHKGIGEALAHSQLAVPPNQREYSWEDEHVLDLLSDFTNAIDSGQSAYFLGTIVLTSGAGDTPEVADGQQRLATATILLATIRDYFQAKKDYQRATSIEQEFLKKIELESKDTVPRLTLNIDDHEFFRKYVVDGQHATNRTRESHERIARAAELVEGHLKAVVKSHLKDEAKAGRLFEWVKFIRTGAQVILMKVPDHMNAFVMFETLNDRGLKASQADLLKNYLLSHCGNRINEGQQKWAHMAGIMESVERDELVMTYLHHFVINRTGPTTAREVFDKVKSSVSSQTRALELLDDLADGAHAYSALFNPDHAKWNKYGTNTRKHITTINRHLRLEQIRPLLFAIARHFSVKEGKRALQLCVFWSVRFLVVGGRGGLLDRNYALQANKIAMGTITTARELYDGLKAILPTDSHFNSAFVELRVSKAYWARYFLRALEKQAKKQPQPELIPNDEENAVNLEHILPENPDGNWPEFDDDTAQIYYKRLGNMAIMQAKKNDDLGNLRFVKKKAAFKKSALVLTAGVAVYTRWSPTEVADRQTRLANLAVEAWPLWID